MFFLHSIENLKHVCFIYEAHLAGTSQDHLQIFNIEAKAKLKSHQMPEQASSSTYCTLWCLIQQMLLSYLIITEVSWSLVHWCCDFFPQVVFWKWITPKMLGLVTASSVYHWSIEGRLVLFFFALFQGIYLLCFAKLYFF